MSNRDIIACHRCRKPTHIHDLDAKPNSARFKRECAEVGQVKALEQAADRGENFERLECKACYGPGYCSM